MNLPSAPNPYESVASAKVAFDVISALPPIKLARTTQGPFRQWLFRVGAYEHQEAYDTEREAMEAAERLLFTLFRDIADEHQRDALSRGNTILAMRYAERRGYWQGRQEEEKLHQAAVGSALAALRYLS
ncbi:hypothetical protein [Pseudomonas oryzihabitans]|uniref:hypothetical protein n=1 Tax=Pseudomonas oryzihabitans TaxID=47885 RepID=UPI002893EA85|nr:hypothetical protein [Pseudomonas oryzihabitans]MDT3722879.1 hypothetical protein [Pseudomonas oryzihabitans]